CFYVTPRRAETLTGPGRRGRPPAESPCYEPSWAGSPNRGNRLSVSRNVLIAATRSPDTSSTTSPHALCRPPGPLDRYWPKAADPHADVRTSRDPRHSAPRPSSQDRIDS